jgi:putative transposase
LSLTLGVSEACRVLGLPRSQMYPRAPQPRGGTGGKPVAPSLRGLSPDERMTVLTTLNSPPYQDSTPREVYGALLTQGRYLCHWRTMYRVLEEQEQVRERRDQLRHPAYHKPQLLAQAPNRVWSWDITRLLSGSKWFYFYLYVIIDIFSRFVVGWMVADQESAEQAHHFISSTCAKQVIPSGQLIIHADRGSPMTAKTTAQLFIDLGVTESHSRPHVSDDNPYSESAFKTMKYSPSFPHHFESRRHADHWAEAFFGWYNYQHCHTSLALLTPATVHFGQTPAILAVRQTALDDAYANHPERFIRHAPVTALPPSAVGINWPKQLSVQPPEVFPSPLSSLNSCPQLLHTP